MNELKKELRLMLDQQLLSGEEEVSDWIKKSKIIDSISRIPGDASSRRYYRLLSQSKTYIVMRLDPFIEQGPNLPFLVIRNHLAQSGVDVPMVFDFDAERGFVLLEDLGDITLLRKLQDVNNPDHERYLYERVIDSLVQLQVHASPLSPIPLQKDLEVLPDAFHLKFDHEKLMWEMNHTIEHFYQIYLKRRISGADLKCLKDGFSEICQTLANEPMVLAHRDFHCRNIMVLPGSFPSTPPDSLHGGKNPERLVMIDFQDARMGPVQYDLASLLKDSYYQLEDSQISMLLDYYIARYEAMSKTSLDRAHFIKIFDLMSVQRNFKAIGSFASFLNRRGEASYLKYIGNTFENIRRNLLKYPRYSKLRETLFHYYYF